jgi:riboflavin-specific deaminase-like protein
VRSLLPQFNDPVDLPSLYLTQPRPAIEARPWVLLSMVTSSDGATAVDGRSGALGGEGDRLVFHAVRAVPDVVLVAAGTVRAESYGAPSPSAAVRELRTAHGMAPAPRLAVVSRSLDLEPDARFLRDATEGNRPWLITVDQADAGRLQELAPHLDRVIIAGTHSVDLGVALAAMRQQGVATVLSEGGPSLNGQLIAQGLVDELCLSVAADLVGGASGRIATHPTERLTRLTLDWVLEHDSALFLRYRRVPSGDGAGTIEAVSPGAVQ